MIEGTTYHFSEDKNKILKETRGISFEEIIFLIEGDCILDVIENPSPKYAHQKIYVIDVGGYAYAVPCVVKGNVIFLKTIHASRDLNKKYKDKLGGKK